MSAIDSIAAAVMGYDPIRRDRSFGIPVDAIGRAGRTLHLSPPLVNGPGCASAKRGMHDLHPLEKSSEVVQPSPLCKMWPSLGHFVLPPPLSPDISLSKTSCYHNLIGAMDATVVTAYGHVCQCPSDKMP
jgi:hypothetical protein